MSQVGKLRAIVSGFLNERDADRCSVRHAGERRVDDGPPSGEEKSSYRIRDRERLFCDEAMSARRRCAGTACIEREDEHPGRE